MVNGELKSACVFLYVNCLRQPGVCVCVYISFTVEILSSADSMVHMITSKHKDSKTNKHLLIGPAAHPDGYTCYIVLTLHHHGLLAQGSLWKLLVLSSSQPSPLMTRTERAPALTSLFCLRDLHCFLLLNLCSLVMHRHILYWYSSK